MTTDFWKVLTSPYRRGFGEMQRFPLGCLPFLFVPGFLFLVAGLAGVKTWQAGRWPVAPGVVTFFDGSEEQTKDGDFYRVLVNYTFVVRGTTYAGDTLSLDTQGKVNADEFAALVRKYPVGKAVTIHYDPGNPDVSVLELSYGMAGQIASVGGLVCLASVILTAVFWRKLRAGVTE